MKSPFPAGGFPKPEKRTFLGRYVILDPVDVHRDATELFRTSHDGGNSDSVWRFMTVGPFSNETSMAMWLHGRTALPDMISFTVRNIATGSVIGSISIMSIRPEHGVAELGFIWLTESARRTKANTETCFLLLRYAFESLGYRRMEWKCDSENAASRTAALRLGFTFEGIFRQHIVYKGRNRDTAWFSIVDHEWPRITEAMKCWLYEETSASLSECIATAQGNG